MKKHTRMLLLSFAILVLFFVGCSNEPTDASPPETDPAVPAIEVIRGGKCLYTLVRPEDCSDAFFRNACRPISTAFMDAFGVTLSVSDDFLKSRPAFGEGVSEFPEILVGETNRRESREVYLTLGAGEYAIKAVGNKIVIIGYNDYCTALAAEKFIEDFISASSGTELSVPSDLSILRTAEVKERETAVIKAEKLSPAGEEIKVESEQWVACEIEFLSSKEYTDPVYTVDMDVVFYNEATDTVLSVPAFWDGGKSWKVRFAPTEIGEWKFYTKCTDTENSGLHHRGGTVKCVEYTGDLAIYRHGFVQTEPGKQYFTYADGTPFFYLGDTHWTLALEEIDSYGSVETQKTAGITKETADQYGITSQFRYIMDYRAEQGYTVIQSQPLDWWTDIDQIWFDDGAENIFTVGVTDVILEKFRQYDRYFKIISEKGFVHSNTHFSYPTTLMSAYFAGKITDEQLEKLCRYWVARYSAYPVLWATTQEGDNDYYGDRGDCAATPETNPWLKVIDFIHKYDAYNHPSTCHQENWNNTTVGNSSFGKLESHTWYAAQYTTPLDSKLDWERLREYWNNPTQKPVVNYEGRYDHFWTGTNGARAQGWIAYMNGQVGYGYGVQPIWSIFWAQNGITDFVSKDESGEFRMDATWLEGLYAEAGEQVTYIKDFLMQYEWWRLVPCFDKSYFYERGSCRYSVCHIGNELYLGYFYGSEGNDKLGKLTAMKNGEYEVRWLNCRTGEYSDAFTVNVTDGTYTLPAKPDAGDWAVSVRFIP